MCGGGGGDDGGAAEREEARQRSIQQGYAQIEKIFGGFDRGVGDVSEVSDDGQYYTEDGQQASIGYQSVANPAYQAPSYQNFFRPTQPETIQQRGIFSDGKYLGAIGSQDLFSGVESVQGFDDDFYNQRSQDYVDYATPQLNNQYEDANKQLTFALSRNGTLDSSSAVDQRSNLLEDYNTQKTQIADQGLGYANDARSSVAGARSDLVALNASLADPTAIANEAQNRLSSLQQKQSFTPLAPLFQNVGEGLATQADLERRGTATYNTGLFNTGSSGSGRIIN